MTAKTLPYSTFGQLLTAFQSGTKFQVSLRSGLSRDVEDIAAYPTGVRVKAKGLSPYLHFKPDGTNSLTPVRLVEVPNAIPEPFLKRFCMGEPLHCPKTREVCAGIGFDVKGIYVALRDEHGNARMSSNYRHDGTHKHDPARSLVFGPVPPLPVPEPAKPTHRTLRIFKTPAAYIARGAASYTLLDDVQVLPNTNHWAGAKPIATVNVPV